MVRVKPPKGIFKQLKVNLRFSKGKKTRPRRPDKPRTNPHTPTKTDKIKEHLTPRDLDAARRELAGEVVARKPNGQPWDHVREVRDAQNGLMSQIRRLQRQLGDDGLSAAQRQAIQDELGEASRLLDYSRQFVP